MSKRISQAQALDDLFRSCLLTAGNQKWKFWMPLHKELLLLATPASRVEHVNGQYTGEQRTNYKWHRKQANLRVQGINPRETTPVACC